MKARLCQLLLLTLGITPLIQAQTQKGTHLIGAQVGNIVFSQRDNVGNSIQLKPTYGYFVMNQLAVGLAIPLYYYNGGIPKGSYQVTQIGLTPFIRYYIGPSLIKPFLSVAAGFQKNKGVGGGSPTSIDYTWGYSAGGGVAFFVTKSVSLDLAANYTGIGSRDYYTLDSYAQNGLTTGVVDAININLGFQVYFGNK